MRRVIACVLLIPLIQIRDAEACGCFALPSPTTPVVQAGERILFAHDGNQVIAYIQIQYQGKADQFGWLVPLPSVPTLKLGTDEVFTKLGYVTQPSFSLTTVNQLCNGGSVSSSSDSSSGIGCGGGDDEAALAASLDLGVAAHPDLGRSDEVVAQSSIGPYDYAVLKADDESEMLKWLNDNRYFIPDGTGEAVKPYIHPGGFFLALKLRAGEQAGDIVPIILSYASDLPMIPITLTQVGAVPNMGILVWVLGRARAIPRNYNHTVLDELPIWLGAKYNDLVISAVTEAPDRHSFLTEYAGPSSVMAKKLDYPGRFGDLTALRALVSPSDYLAYLRAHGYLFDATLLSLLERFIPEPAQLVTSGITLDRFYASYDFYASQLGHGDGGVADSFDAAGLTDAIDLRIVQPTRAAQALFDQSPYLTRLYTTLSPKDMNLDPVFSENPDLHDVPLVHSATATYPCSGSPWLRTDQGFEAQLIGGALGYPPTLRLEHLRESGQPEVVTDNTALIKSEIGPVSHGSSTRPDSSSGGLGCGGCDTSRRARNQLGTALAVALALAWIRLRRRPTRRG
jgi:hypothetical protein